MGCIALAWIMCSVADAGLLFAYYQREYPDTAKEEFLSDSVFCTVCSLFGPLSLLTILHRATKGHGFKLPFTR